MSLIISNLIGDINSLAEVDNILGLIDNQVKKNPYAFRQYDGSSNLYETYLRLQLRKQHIDAILSLEQPNEGPVDFSSV